MAGDSPRDGPAFLVRNRTSEDGPVPSTADAAQARKNRPKASRLRQQQLPAWQPILTASTVIPTIFLIGIIFIPIGIALFLASHKVQEWSTYYENCSQSICTIKFDLTELFAGDVYFYYGLENYFQNHRRYMKSRNDKQLMGFLEETSECDPFSKIEDTVIAPCGAIANSMFNDTFRLTRESSTDQIPWVTDGLVWMVDRETKFKNPNTDGEVRDLCAAFQNTVKPPNWKKKPCELDLNNEENNGFRNADFQIWMRTAALPDFRKPYRALDRSNPIYAAGLPKGSYTLTIENNYPVNEFSGRKSFIISTTTWAGGRNTFLGYAYIIVGSICIILGVVFLVVHIKFGHNLSELAVVN